MSICGYPRFLFCSQNVNVLRQFDCSEGVIVPCVYFHVSVCDICLMAYIRVQNSGHFLATLAWLRHLGFAGVCTDCNKRISYKET